MAINPRIDFSALLHLLQQEKDEDLAQFQKKMQSTSLKERRAKGVLWFPCNLFEQKHDTGERLIISVKRPKEHSFSHSFSNGKLVEVFPVSDENTVLRGVVNRVKEDTITVTINADDFPQWLKFSQIAVQLLFDDRTYFEMQEALKHLMLTEDARLIELQKKFYGEIPLMVNQDAYVAPNHLNKSQSEAVAKVVSANDIAVVHGPPGTGKTTTLVEAIKQVLFTETQVLVCAPSNTAVDLLAEKLTQEGVSVVRIGHPARVTDELLNQTLEAKVAQHQDYKLLKDLKKRSEEYFKMAGKWKRSFGSAEREQRKIMLTEARSLKKDAERTHNDIVDDVLFSARVVATTLVGANHKRLKRAKFPVCFIDEAGQALEPACWIPIIKSKKVVFAGDHKQLPPTVKSYEAGKAGLNYTLFERAINNLNADVLLTEQYRMHETIMNFSSREFYDGLLVANERNKLAKVYPSDTPLEFIDTAGTAFFEQQHPDTKSSFNPDEADLMIKHLQLYTAEVLNAGYDLPESIGIISPYKAQIGLIKLKLETSDLAAELLKKITVNTIDGFQGQERDVIYISLVRSNEKGEIGFLGDERRMNVALTRAKRKLVVIGDSATLAVRNKFYDRFLDFVQLNNAHKSAFEFMY